MPSINLFGWFDILGRPSHCKHNGDYFLCCVFSVDLNLNRVP